MAAPRCLASTAALAAFSNSCRCLVMCADTAWRLGKVQRHEERRNVNTDRSKRHPHPSSPLCPFPFKNNTNFPFKNNTIVHLPPQFHPHAHCSAPFHTCCSSPRFKHPQYVRQPHTVPILPRPFDTCCSSSRVMNTRSLCGNPTQFPYHHVPLTPAAAPPG